jgi:hypothetical protein
MAVLLAASCSAAPEPSATLERLLVDAPAEVTTAPTTHRATTTAAPRPRSVEPDEPAIPDGIDLAYVEEVVNGLFAIDGELMRDVLARPLRAPFSDRDVAVLQALYDGPERAARTMELQQSLQHAAYRSAVFPPDRYDQVRFTALRLHDLTWPCVTVLGWADQSRTALEPLGRDEHVAFVLVHVPDQDRTRNPTGWRIWDNNLLRSADGPIPPEDWPDLSFGSVLDTTCGRGGDA